MQLVDIHAFKKEIKKPKPGNCPCRICKTYIPRVGFIWSFKVIFVYENTCILFMHVYVDFKTFNSIIFLNVRVRQH